MSSWVTQLTGKRFTQRSYRRSCVAAVLFIVALVAPSAALGADSFRPGGSFAESGSGAGELFDSSPRLQMAVNEDDQQIFVADGGQGIQVFDAGGPGTPTYLTTITGISYPASLAVDQDTGELYVSDWGASQIVRYTSDGAPTPTFSRDLTYLGPPAGFDPVSINDFGSPIAVDPTTGDLLVGDAGDRTVKRFSRGGAFLSGFATQADMLDIEVDPTGVVYIAAVEIGQPLPSADARNSVRRYAADGTRLADLPALGQTPTAVAIDSSTGNTVVADRQSFDGAGAPQVPVVHVYDGQVPVDTVELPAGTSGSRVPALAVDGTNGRLFVLTRPQASGGIYSVQVLDPVEKPDVTVAPPTDVTATGATLHGTIDPLGATATVHFETSADGQSWQSTTDQVVSAPQAVEARQDGLKPNTEYRVRLVATTADGAIRSPERTFSTGIAPPGVVTGRATDRAELSTTLRGSVNPYGLQSTYYFEYGTTVGYGTRVPAGHANVAGNGRTPRAVAIGIDGLTPGTTYHYRLVAQNEAGVAFGPDRTFTTRTVMPARAFEQVSPAEKGGSSVNPRMNFRSSADGSRIAFRWRTAPSGSVSAPTFPQSVAQREAASWRTFAVDPPQIPRDLAGNGGGVVIATTLGISEDLKKAVVVSRRKLADGATEGKSNFYLQDFAGGTYTWMATSPRPEGIDGAGLGQSVFLGGDHDFSHVLLGGQPYPLLPGAPDYALYEWSGGQLRLASIDQNGDPQPSTLAFGGYDGATDPSWISSDGSRVFFDVQFGSTYARIGGATIPLSQSQRTSDRGTMQPGLFTGASADGTVAYFLSRDLTDDSPAGVQALYRFNVASRTLTFVVAAPDLDVNKVMLVSPSGREVFFTSTTDMAPGAVVNEPNVYVWRDGQVRLIATLQAPETQIDAFQRHVSLNGRYFVFSAFSKLTEYDNSSTTRCNDFGIDPIGEDACAQVYRYDVETGELLCVSCRPDDGPVTGNAYVGTPRAARDGDVYHPRVALDDGRVVFDTTEGLDRRDRNGERDVYLYDDGDAVLVSGGRGAGSSELADITPDGRSVFFTTNDQLVPTDEDTSTDVYVARIDGGLPTQRPEQLRGGCTGEDCRGAGSSPAPGPPPASQNGGQPVPTQKRSTKPSARVGEASFRGTTLRLAVNVSGSGRIRVTGSKVVTASRTATKAGTYRLEVRLKKPYREQRRRGRAVRARVAVKFTPAFGKSVTSTLTRTAAR